ncbi:MAG: hypothetical protein M3R45_03775 [Pseudomonadota bacterium]|nr:hypothetical protein [Pseudomonadota bacterium]
MFSDHLVKINRVPTKVLSLVCAGLVFGALLGAMVVVMQGQVERMHMRDAQEHSEKNAIVQCMQNEFGTALDRCVRGVRSAAHLASTAPAQDKPPVALNQAPRLEATALAPARQAPGLMPAFVATR